MLKKILKYFNITPYVYYTYKYNDPFSIKKKKFANQKNVVIFDVGAHDGRSALNYNKVFKNSSIFSFEPTPNTFRILKRETGNYRNINIYNQALSSFVGQTSFNLNSSSLTNSILNTSEKLKNIVATSSTVQSITVGTNTIDNFCSQNSITKINILKIDVQGADLEVLKGAKAMLEMKMIDLIFVEVEFIELYVNQPLFHDISSFLHNYDYSLYSLYNLSIDKEGRLIYGDAIFIPK
jgi:FkbM family methyltransferase